jgi:predicted CXXCH cytochrome family protein
MKKSLFIINSVIPLILLLGLNAVRGQDSVVGSPHDLSVSGFGAVHALTEERVCVFCHAPHNATGQAPLWNRHMPRTHYRVYESSTTDARIDQPYGPSKMCLSCHDGAMAVGLVASRPSTEPIVMSRRTIPPGPSDLTEDLSDDHPIGFRYDRALANRDRQLKNPDIVTPLLPMGSHNEVHCTTCHDPHDNSLGDFLRIPDVRSAICLSCHDMDGWHSGSHGTSTARVRARGVNRDDRLPYDTVADNGCTSCHKVHSADSRERLLRHRLLDDNCLTCHDGSVAKDNIASEMRKRSAHNVLIGQNRHDPNEDPRIMPRHVTCADCHNPHATSAGVSRNVVSSTPKVAVESLRFVSGVNRSGIAVDRARYEYEICFKCHSDNLSRPRTPDIVRQITQTNTRLEFQTNNPSFHPVIGSANLSDSPSLLPPYRGGSVIACTDCHNSDTAGRGNAAGVNGPHGSIYEPLLIDNYETDDFTIESPQSYALCYRCHDRQSLLNDESFPLHRQHIVTGRAPCSACHDAHGISRTQGNTRSNSHLINFDRSIVQPAGSSAIQFIDQGRLAGSCTLTCHGVAHVRFEYGR